MNASETDAALHDKRRWTVLFAATIFVSAFLLFQVQPLISKRILPWFGGSPAVWTTAMLFFQCLLFAGYAYAHGIVRYGTVRQQTLVHFGLLGLATVGAFFVLPHDRWKPAGDEQPVAYILALLAACVGLPYFCLAITGPLLQYWFSLLYPNRSPYRLYAISNIGSFLALLSFPFVMEPWFELSSMGLGWIIGFCLFAGLSMIVAAVTLRAASTRASQFSALATTDDSHAPPSTWQRARWIVLPALASLTMIAATDHVSHDIAPEPRVWVFTLCLYLLTFIICFDHPRWYRRGIIACMTVIAIVLLSGRREIPAWFDSAWSMDVTSLRWSHFLTMFLICFLCHGEVVRARPASSKYLTEFYLCLAFGGACGGLFVTFIATPFFADYYEWTVCLLAGLLLAVFIAIQTFCIYFGRRTFSLESSTMALIVFALLGWVVFYWQDPFQWQSATSPDSEFERTVLHRSRNFYGAVAVVDLKNETTPTEDYRIFFSGQVTHGMQFTHPDKRATPISFYARESGVGDTLDYLMGKRPSLRVAVVGLGSGAMATYARASDRYDFYEINPSVVEIAENWFDNLRLCEAEYHIVLGDARLKLEQLSNDVQYDVIILDAFSGGSVPIHLLTREAFATYHQHLKPDGFLIANITNAWLNFYPVLKRQSEQLSMGFRYKSSPPVQLRRVRRAKYFIMTNDAEYLANFPSENSKFYDSKLNVTTEEDPEMPGVPLWTDHFSSIRPIEWKH